MTAPAGYIDLDRTVESIQVGRRHRQDLGDLDALAASIARDGLLQPITVTPGGLLVCGARRLAAIRRLGWRTVSVWVRSSISDLLGHLLAEQDDNQLHKALSPLEAAGLYREIKQLMAEDAARRESASQFTSAYQPRWNGTGKFPGPLDTPAGDPREQAAAMIPGAPSYRTLDKIGFLQHLAADPDIPERLRAEARAGLASIEAGEPVDPVYQQFRDAHRQTQAGRDAHLHQLAEAALARIERAKTKKPARRTPARDTPGGSPTRYPVRAFVLTWTELDNWWTHYDADLLAAELTDEQLAAFLAAADGTHRFAARLRAAREHTKPGDNDDAAAGPTGRPRLRAL